MDQEEIALTILSKLKKNIIARSTKIISRHVCAHTNKSRKFNLKPYSAHKLADGTPQITGMVSSALVGGRLNGFELDDAARGHRYGQRETKPLPWDERVTPGNSRIPKALLKKLLTYWSNIPSTSCRPGKKTQNTATNTEQSKAGGTQKRIQQN